MHNFEIKPKLDNVMKKLSKKDKALFEQILNKIKEIANCSDIEHYKNLRYNLKEFKRAHIGHFVLVFSYDKNKDFIYFEYFAHHDNIYE